MFKRKGLSKKAKVLWKIFWVTSAVTMTVCVTTLGAGVLVWNKVIYQEEKIVEDTEIEVEATEEEPIASDEVAKEKEAKKEEPEPEPLNKTVAVFGVDAEGYRTDVLLVGHFNSLTNEVDVISIPRDTHVVWTEEQKEHLKAGNEWVRESKLNEMTAYTGIEEIRGSTINYLETVLSAKIDNYVVIDTSAFREIVDTIGGVTLDVPQRMKYDDYSQDLHIDLYPGLQTLNGSDAEGFVRYRHDYVMGDLKRIEVQRLFLEALTEQVTKPTIILKAPEILSVVLGAVKTDMKIQEVKEYLPYLSQFDPNKLSFHTLEGSYERIEGREYYQLNEEAARVLGDEVFCLN